MQSLRNTQHRAACPRVGGDLFLAGIRPGVGFRLAVLDRLTGAVVQERELKLETGEHRGLDWVLDISDRPLTVKVRDSGGRPVPAAHVEVHGGGARLTGTIPYQVTCSIGRRVARVPSWKGRENDRGMDRAPADRPALE